MSDTQWTPIAGCLFTSAKGRSWREEAATWLLAEFGFGTSHWPDQLDKAGFLRWEEADDDPEDADPEDQYDTAEVCWAELAGALITRASAVASMHGTNAEWVVLRFACALMTGSAGDWGRDLSLLDEGNRRLVLAALAWAGGGLRAAAPFMPRQPDPEPPTVRSHLHTVPD